ncbi:hypothetical protein [Saccharothrix violaceirubra]|uniref:Uncharacterized protein n=1 Tax=Saccharothrix violaceirubra TaxID=413306 RepID=A0A7W7T253_9PSEU|nr:hypothetical protein [Saccharothrix violaceirubra]MBB4965197.1 hypothetical protein [Saccharothrix violaceirubra]
MGGTRPRRTATTPARAASGTPCSATPSGYRRFRALPVLVAAVVLVVTGRVEVAEPGALLT